MFTKTLLQRHSVSSQFAHRLGSNEPVTVFATHQSDYRASGTANHNAFMPSNKYGNTSSFRILDLLAPEIWYIAENHVKNINIKKIYGRMDFLAETVYRLKLDFDPDNNPVRHANIVKWPDNKTAKKSVAQQIAAESTFHCEVTYKSYVAQASYNKRDKCLCGYIDISGKKIEFKSDTVKNLSQALEVVVNDAMPHTN